MHDTNYQNIQGNVNEVNGIKIEKAYITQDSRAANERSKMLRELLYYRYHCKPIHITLCNYVRDTFGLKEAMFVNLTDQQLKQLYQFSQPLREVFFVYNEKIQDPKHKLAYRMAYLIQPVIQFFRRGKIK